MGFGIHHLRDKEALIAFFEKKKIKYMTPDTHQLTTAANATLDAVHELKQQWDPRNLLNPGKLDNLNE